MRTTRLPCACLAAYACATPTSRTVTLDLFLQSAVDNVPGIHSKAGGYVSDDEAAAPRYDLLDLSNAIGRLGVAYFTNICAQAHLGFSEKRPGEDNLALGRVP